MKAVFAVWSGFIFSSQIAASGQEPETPLPLLEQLSERTCGHRLAEQEALRLIAAHFPEQTELVFGFDAFCHNAHSKGVRERDDRGDERLAGALFRQAVDERAVDLQRVDWQFGEAA